MREFWAKGYRDTSVGDLVVATGVQPGSLYGAFEGGKRQLFIEALKLYSRLVVPQKLGALERPGASIAEVRAYFDGLVSDLMSPEGRIGCLMVNTTVELAAEDSEVAALTRAHMARLEASAGRALRTARDRSGGQGDAADGHRDGADGGGQDQPGKGGAGDHRRRGFRRPELTPAGSAHAAAPGTRHDPERVFFADSS